MLGMMEIQNFTCLYFSCDLCTGNMQLDEVIMGSGEKLENTAEMEERVEGLEKHEQRLVHELLLRLPRSSNRLSYAPLGLNPSPCTEWPDSNYHIRPQLVNVQFTGPVPSMKMAREHAMDSTL